MRITKEWIEERVSQKVSAYIAAGYRIVNAKGSSMVSSIIYSIELFWDGNVIIVVFESMYDKHCNEHITIGAYSFEENAFDQYRTDDGNVLFRESYVTTEDGRMIEE